MKTNLFSGLLIAGALSLTLFGCSLDDQIRDLQGQIDQLKQETADKQKALEELIAANKDSNAATQKALEDYINRPVDPDPTFTIVLPDEGVTEVDIYPGEMRSVSVSGSGLSNIAADLIPAGWGAFYDPQKSALVVSAPAALFGPVEIGVSGTSDKGVVYRSFIKLVPAAYDAPQGLFVVNEGMAWGANATLGSLLFVRPDRAVAVPNAYFTVNGATFGGVAEDMAECDGKLYVIAQNNAPGADGPLAIFDGKSLKKIDAYLNEDNTLSMPTHVAALDDANIFIRDNRGIYRYDSTTKKLSYVEGSDGARKNTMITIGGKVIADNGSSLLVLEKGSDKVTATLKLDGAISGLARADADNFYVSYYHGYDSDLGSIALVKAADLTVTKTNDIKGEQAQPLNYIFAASSHISAKGDTVYFSGTAPKIYRHLFSTGETKEMFDSSSVNPGHPIIYNTATVSPLTGHVFFNSLAGYGALFATNTLYEIDMTGDAGKLVRRYDDYTRYPAGIFFPFAD